MSSRQSAILDSITMHKSNLLKDINLKIRLTDAEDKTYTTTLIRWDDTVITFAAPLNKRDWVIFPLPLRMDCSFVTRGTLYMTTIEITRSHRSNTGLLYKATILSPLIRKQQRAHFRLDLLLDMHYAILTTAQGERLENVTKANCTCVNISAGGLCINTTKSLEANQHIAVFFSLLECDFTLVGKLLTASSKNHNGTYSSRIQFMDVTPEQENLLSRLILEKQRLLIKNKPRPLFPKNS